MNEFANKLEFLADLKPATDALSAEESFAVLVSGDEFTFLIDDCDNGATWKLTRDKTRALAEWLMRQTSGEVA